MSRFFTLEGVEIELGPTWFKKRDVRSGSPAGKHSFEPKARNRRAALPSASHVANGGAARHPYGFKAETPNGTDTLWWYDK